MVYVIERNNEKYLFVENKKIPIFAPVKNKRSLYYLQKVILELHH